MNDYNLERFVEAQKRDYQDALNEIRAGRKRSHWIWYIFPQIAGLGRSHLADFYSICCLEEAKAYMQVPFLRDHLLEISEALLDLDEENPLRVMGRPDDLKLRSSMTLFAEAAPEYDVFQKVLDKYYHGEKDPYTLRILERQKMEQSQSY